MTTRTPADADGAGHRAHDLGSSIVEATLSNIETDHRTQLHTLLQHQRRDFIAQGPPSLSLRLSRIDRLVALVLDNADDFIEAMRADFGARSRPASLLTEILGMIGVVEHTRKHVKQWMRPTKLLPAAHVVGLHARVEPTPLGVVGVIGPWNFPLNLVVMPTVSAFAAGNRVMIKMSEITPHTAELTKKLASRYFDPTELAVITGGPDVAAAFSALAFDHLFFTGSAEIGSLVQRAASHNLVPVTLELGGKNPVVVAPEADIATAAARLAAARLVNGGQVCLCPDYVFVEKHRVDDFLAEARRVFRAMCPTIVNNPDYCSSVNEANFDRVLGLLDDAAARGAVVEAVVPAGESLPDRHTRKIAPTLVHNVDDTMSITSHEIFGPVLVVMDYDTVGDVIDYINERPSPLVAYWYGPDGARFRSFVAHTRSGGVARNDFAAQAIPAAAPFGGVGRSGMGAYHGKAGFDAFTHYRSVVGSDLPFSITGAAAPPFSRHLKIFAEIALSGARMRTRRRLQRGRQTPS